MRQHSHLQGRLFNREHLRTDDEAWREYVARYTPPRRVTLADVWRMVAGPTARFLARHARAALAAVRAYRSAL